MTVSLHTLKERFLDILFPLECIICGEEGAYCCSACLHRIRPVKNDMRVRKALLDHIAFGYAYAEPAIHRLIHAYKYQHNVHARDALEILLQRWTVSFASYFEGYALVPVPLHPKREAARGFNQSKYLAEIIHDTLGNPVADGVLARSRHTLPQSADSIDRKVNVSAAFRVTGGIDAGKKYMLIDDIWTSGATMYACAHALRDAGVGHIAGFAFAKA